MAAGADAGERAEARGDGAGADRAAGWPGAADHPHADGDDLAVALERWGRYVERGGVVGHRLAGVTGDDRAGAGQRRLAADPKSRGGVGESGEDGLWRQPRRAATTARGEGVAR